jgi:hypothetical protein
MAETRAYYKLVATEDPDVFMEEKSCVLIIPLTLSGKFFNTGSSFNIKSWIFRIATTYFSMVSYLAFRF